MILSSANLFLAPAEIGKTIVRLSLPRFLLLSILIAIPAGCDRMSRPSIHGAKSGEHPKPADVDAARLTDADRDAGNWMSYGRTYTEQRFSPLKQIDEHNISQLGFAWHYDLDTHRGQEATPIVVDGVMYFTSAWSKAYALNAATGALLWSYDPKVPPETAVNACCDVVNRGVAVWRGKVFFGTLDGRLDRARCRHRKENLGDANDGSGQALHHHRRTARGERQSADRQWRRGNGRARLRLRLRRGDRHTFLALLHRSRRSLEAVRRSDSREGRENVERENGGNSAAVARFGTPSSTIPSSISSTSASGTAGRGPENFAARVAATILLTCSIVALKPDTGEYVWHYQEDPNDDWDYDSDEQIILADLNINGGARKVILHAPKNGFFYVLDRATGELISAKPFTFVNWATGIDLKTGRPIENPAARYVSATKPSPVAPGPLGAHSWQPMSYSPLTGLRLHSGSRHRFLLQIRRAISTEAARGKLRPRHGRRGHAARSEREKSDSREASAAA